ncbi:MAG: hypothetical protein ACR2JB_07755 [Bryobacteraceae bacterium]
MPVLLDHERKLHETKALAGARWQENGLMFPSEVGSPADERNVLRRFQKLCSDNELPKLRVYELRHTHASLLINKKGSASEADLGETRTLLDQTDDGHVRSSV